MKQSNCELQTFNMNSLVLTWYCINSLRISHFYIQTPISRAQKQLDKLSQFLICHNNYLYIKVNVIAAAIFEIVLGTLFCEVKNLQKYKIYTRLNLALT